MNNKDIDIVSSEISLYIESVNSIIDSMTTMNITKMVYFTEARKVNDLENKIDKSIIDKIKEAIYKVISKLKNSVSSFFNKGKVSTTYTNIEKIGEELESPTIQGVNFGKIKVKLPNVYEYDKHLSNLMLKSIAEVSVKNYKEYSKKMQGSTKIDLLRESIDDITG